MKFSLIGLLLINLVSYAQLFPAKNYPKGYFSWPVDAKIALAANFGELRPNHYHMGLDCKSDQVENRSVMAAAEGYIAKVKIEPFGFGRCIYINHSNGLTTLYAHLNDFYPALEQYITNKQYQLKSWNVFLDLPAGMFPVKKGQFIAFSGNTGGSQGPHVHFEIRETKTDKVLNPLLFGFPLEDNIAPDILRVAVYDRAVSTYEQTPQFYSVKKINGILTTSPSLVIVNSPKISFAITAYDRYSGSTNKNGIFQAILSENEKPLAGFQMDGITYDETRYLNAHIDYKLHNSGGTYVQHLGYLPGYTNGIYFNQLGNGVVNMEDGLVHPMKIVVKDANGNTSLLQLNIQYKGAKQEDKKMLSKTDGQKNEFRPGFINVFENAQVRFYLPENALYDSIRFTFKEIIPTQGNPIYQLHNGDIPVHSMFSINIKNPAATYPNKMVMHRFWRNKNDYSKADHGLTGYEKDWYRASFREFGNFQLIEDTIPPNITAVGFKEGMNISKQNRLAFVIKDDTEELENFTALLDGKWIRFSNDKGAVFIYRLDEHCPPGEHELKITVADCVGNKSERTYHFTR
ncbi:MAG: M23 family metallopeptidase [Chitinophagia bacterium]|nr:M23 family metallopeptidase [Chitinophagia bacterium]